MKLISNKPFVTLVPEVEVVVLALGTAVVGVAVDAAAEPPAVVALTALVVVTSFVHVPLVVARIARGTVIIALAAAFDQILASVAWMISFHQ